MPDRSSGAGRTLPPWVLIAGGLHTSGGMDKANLALAQYLVARGTPLVVVSHRVDSSLLRARSVELHLVRRPLQSFALGEVVLDRAGRAVARRVLARTRQARVVVNGGNCLWPDVNWVHALHHGWPPVDSGAPAWFRVKNAAFKRAARRRERRSLLAAKIVVVNSNRTRNDVVERLGIEPERVKTVYLGSDAGTGPATPAERQAARHWLGLPAGVPVVAFVGALGHDRNKGFDSLWAAWRQLAEGEKDVHLVVAGDGARLWQREAEGILCGSRVRFTGFTSRVPDVLAAADVLVSPVRYESYGLNVHEALCRGTPAVVSRSAGIAERFPASLDDMLLSDPEDVAELTGILRRWLADREGWRGRIRPFAESLRAYTWCDMAERFVTTVEEAGELARK
ncbi:MAG: glycosyltransferase family 4 protein [Vicinamibacterales bacterium]